MDIESSKTQGAITKHETYQLHTLLCKKREETKRYQKSPDETRRDKKGEDGTG